MACFDGLCGGNSSPSVTETIHPTGFDVVSKETAPRVRLLKYELMFNKVPLSAASYPVLAFRLARCEAGVLEAALAAALAVHPMLAGRLCNDEVALTNEGAPFTVCSDPAAHAPEDFEEGTLIRFADFRDPPRVRKGLEPLITVKLTRFRDGSAVLAFCRSHGLLDGTSAWAFIADWARAARGQPLQARMERDRAAIEGLLPSEEQIVELSNDLHGKTLTKSWKGWAFEYMIPPVCFIWDRLFLSGLAFPNRPRLFLSDDEVSRIKVAATPAPGTAGDGWVSTQEALAAYILLTVARATLPATSQGRAMLFLLLDPRKALGLPETTCMGCGLCFVAMQVKGILQMELADLANEIHETAKVKTSPEVLRKTWLLNAGLNEKGMDFEAMNEMMKMRMKSDIILQLNNQSKRQVPDFGEGSGGRAEAVLTNAGPTLILPAQGGLEILFCSSFLGSSTGKKAAKAMHALRTQLPMGGPTLLGAQRIGAAGAGDIKSISK